MKIKTSLFLTILLIFICCIGAASASEDVNNDTLTTTDDVVIADAVVDAPIQAQDTSDNTLEVSNDEEKLSTSGTATVSSWTDLKTYSETSGTDYTINLVDNTVYTATNGITFANSATIVGTANSYITTDGTYSGIIFLNSDNSASITFRNVNFKDMSCQMVIQLAGTSTLDNCTFDNITLSSGRNSVVYNTEGFMNIVDCSFTNCTAPYGAVSNYNSASVTSVRMNVTNSKFENNYASTEPGAINNCGLLNVTNSTFTKNRAALWAGAINTYTNAQTIIRDSTFTSNTAGWNGGALYTYSVLKVYNSIFEDNNCSTSFGGGAIGSYNFGSGYDILINNCTFKKNYNLASNGRGGAIATLNGGYLNVYNSTFIANYAATGQAIAATNQKIENGTSDKPYLSIEGNTFINHTGSSDTVSISGRVSSFKNNIFINSTQNTYWGSGNTYNAVNNLLKVSNSLLGVSMEDTLNTVSSKIVDVSSDDELWDAYATDNGGDIVDIVISEGTYTKSINYSIDQGNELWLIDDNVPFVVESKEGIVIFKFDDGYDLDTQYTTTMNWDGEQVSSILHTITHKNIIFDCDVTIGSKNFDFVDCTFNNILNVNNYDWDYDQYYPYESTAKINITFQNCIFNFSKDEINTNNEKINLIFNDCTFPVTAVNTTLNIVQAEKNVIVTLKDEEGNPIANAAVAYTINGNDAVNATTGDDGTIVIPNLKGKNVVNVTYEGNDSYSASNSSETFIFQYATTITYELGKNSVIVTLKDEEGNPVSDVNVTYNVNDINGNLTTDENGTITISNLSGVIIFNATFGGNELYSVSNITDSFTIKYNTKITATKVTATYNVAKKLVITLKDENDKVIANKTVTVKVGSISKTLTTNAKGQVSVNVATLTPKSYYTATFKFAGDDLYTASSSTAKVVVKKATPKITAAKKTFKVKTKTKKYTITLKNNKGKVLKKTKVTLTVKGETYKATTNAKGKATFKITKLTKKGKFKAVVKFKGNKYYNKVSKTVKYITVKK